MKNRMCETISVFLIVLFANLPVVTHALVILQYHHVSDNTPKSTSISPRRFERHMQLIEESGYHVISIEDVAQRLRKGKKVEDKTVVISFDDGFKSIYQEALPRLKKRNWPFVVFVNTQPHDQRLSSHMSWEQLNDIRKHGATIANHGVTHAHFLRREHDPSGSTIMVDEILLAEKRILEKVGQSVKLFAYPYGEYDHAMMNQLKKHDFIAFGQHSGAVPSDVDLRRVPRFPFGGNFGSDEDFLTKLRTKAIEGVTWAAVDGRGSRVTEPLLPQSVDKPVWRLHLPKSLSSLSFNCFASGQGAAQVRKENRQLIVQAKKRLQPGRSKYNCTALAEPGRFYWLSKLWIRKQDDGSWYAE